MALATASQMKSYLRVLTGTTEDTLLDTFVTRFDAIAAAWCGFPNETGAATFEDGTYTHYFDGDGTDRLQLRIAPAVSITTVHVDVDRAYGASTLVDSGDYELFGSDGLLLLKTTSSQGAFSKGYRSVKVVYVAGYATIPDDIIHACGMQVSHWYRNRDNIGFQNVSQTGGSVSVAGLELLESVRQSLRPYRFGGEIGGFIG